MQYCLMVAGKAFTWKAVTTLRAAMEKPLQREMTTAEGKEICRSELMRVVGAIASLS